MSEQQRRDFALWLIRDIEPAWGFKLDVAWIRQYEALASASQLTEGGGVS